MVAVCFLPRVNTAGVFVRELDQKVCLVSEVDSRRNTGPKYCCCQVIGNDNYICVYTYIHIFPNNVKDMVFNIFSKITYLVLIA